MMNLKEIVTAIQPIDQDWISKARERTAQLVMPTRAPVSYTHLTLPTTPYV